MGFRMSFRVSFRVGFRAYFRAAGRLAAGDARHVDTRTRWFIGRGVFPLPLGLDDDVAWHQDLVPGDLDVVGRTDLFLLWRAYLHRLLQGQVGPGYLHRGVTDPRVVQRAPQGLRDQQILPRQRHGADGFSLLVDGPRLSLVRLPISLDGRRGHVGTNPHAHRR